VHGLAIGAGLVGITVLMAVAIPQASFTLTLSLLVYGCGLLAMLICSVALWTMRGSRRRRSDRRSCRRADVKL
jgi:predicted membrane channel-forming protein YqfA (hemolysin III family)